MAYSQPSIAASVYLKILRALLCAYNLTGGKAFLSIFTKNLQFMKRCKSLRLNIFVSLFFLFISTFLNATTLQDCDRMIVDGVKAMSERRHSQSLEILTKAQAVAHEKRWYRQEFLALNNIGANYYAMLDYGEALNKYLEAYKTAIMYLDYTSEMTVLNNIAILYSQEKKFKKSEAYFLKAYDLALKGKDSTKIGIYAINIANVANETHQTQKSTDYLNTAFSVLKNKDLLLQTKVVQAENLLLRERFAEAKTLALQLLPDLKAVEFKDNRVILFLILARIAVTQKDWTAAISWCQKALAENADLTKKEMAFNQLSTVYEYKNDLRTALRYKDSVLVVHDSINAIKNGKLFENSRIKFELQHSEKVLAESQTKLRTQYIIFVISTGFILTLIISFILFLHSKNIRIRQEKVIENNTKKIIELKLEQERKDREILQNQYQETQVRSLLQEEKLKNEVEAKNRKLMVKVLQLASKNELIESVIHALMQHADTENSAAVNAAVNQLKQGLREESEQTDFLMHFEEVNRGFLQRLQEKHPDLSSNDVRFLSYVYMNLSSKEVSALLNITLEACRKRKERIAKKMNLTKDGDLYTYLSAV